MNLRPIAGRARQFLTHSALFLFIAFLFALVTVAGAFGADLSPEEAE